MTVHGPDGRPWKVTRRPDPPRLAGWVLPGAWQVIATAPDETRTWAAASRREARKLTAKVALALRTGAEGPPGELAPDPSV